MKRKPIFILMMLLFGILIAGCSSKSSPSESAPQDMENEWAMEEDWDENWDGEEMAAEDGELGLEEGSPQKNKDQKLIYRASRNIEVTQKIEPLVLRVQNFVESHNGYIQNMEQYRNGYDPVSQEELEGVNMVIRIPHEHYNKALTTIEELGAVVHKTSSVEDVTLQYSDLASTLKMYKVEQDRLLEMIENETTDVTDLIEIEKRLSEVRIQMERYESARRALESQINYDTIELEINQVRTVSNINQPQSFGKRIKSAFLESIDNAKIFIQASIIAVAYLFIPAMIMLAIFGAGYFIFRKVYIKRKNKKN